MGEVLPDRLSGSALQAAAWLLRHQRPDGSFAYEYAPPERREAKAAWTPYDQLVRQCGCAWAMAMVARLSRDRKIGAAAAATAIGGILERHLQTRWTRPPLLSAGHVRRGQAGRAAACCCWRSPSWDRLCEFRAKPLINSRLRCWRYRRPTATSAPGLAEWSLKGSETYYAGQIVLALARLYGIRKRPRLRTVVQRSLKHYQVPLAESRTNATFRSRPG